MPATGARPVWIRSPVAETLHPNESPAGGRHGILPRLITHFHHLSGHLGVRILTFVLTIAAALVASRAADLDCRLRTLADDQCAFFSGALGSGPAIAETLVQMIPLLIAGLAVAVAFHAGLFNIGVEGQLVFGGLVAGVVGARLDLPARSS